MMLTGHPSPETGRSTAGEPNIGSHAEKLTGSSARTARRPPGAGQAGVGKLFPEGQFVSLTTYAPKRLADDAAGAGGLLGRGALADGQRLPDEVARGSSR